MNSKATRIIGKNIVDQQTSMLKLTWYDPNYALGYQLIKMTG